MDVRELEVKVAVGSEAMVFPYDIDASLSEDEMLQEVINYVMATIDISIY